MGIIKFELKKEHLSLIKNLEWDLNEDNFIITRQPAFKNAHDFPIKSPFGGDDVFEDMFLILVGNSKQEVDVMDDDFTLYSDEEKETFKKLLEELPTALSVISHTQSFELGKYKTKFNVKDWVKYD